MGRNYHDHSAEQDEEPPDSPLLIAKAPSAVTNPGDPIYHLSDLLEPGQTVTATVEGTGSLENPVVER